jgi:hypothetical protein
VLLSQTDDPGVSAAAEVAAQRLGLRFEHEHTGLDHLAEAVEVGLTNRVC